MQNNVIIFPQTVDMYKEKVARQEIGVLTAPCKIPYVQKMVPPARPEEPNIEYERVPISYTSLDLIGHGVWDGNKTVCSGMMWIFISEIWFVVSDEIWIQFFWKKNA